MLPIAISLRMMKDTTGIFPNFRWCLTLLRIRNENAITEALNRIDPQNSTILTLYYLEELGLNELADIMGISVANIKVRLHRGRKQLKAVLESMLNHEVKSIL